MHRRRSKKNVCRVTWLIGIAPYALAMSTTPNIRYWASLVMALIPQFGCPEIYSRIHNNSAYKALANFINRSHQYTTLKIFTRTSPRMVSRNRELEMFEHISAIKSSHPGRRFVRTMLESFDISWSGGQHLCIVQRPMWVSLAQIQNMGSTRKFHKELLKATIRYLLQALDYLHTQCHVIHTGMCTVYTELAHESWDLH